MQAGTYYEICFCVNNKYSILVHGNVRGPWRGVSREPHVLLLQPWWPGNTLIHSFVRFWMKWMNIVCTGPFSHGRRQKFHLGVKCGGRRTKPIGRKPPAGVGNFFMNFVLKCCIFVKEITNVLHHHWFSGCYSEKTDLRLIKFLVNF